MAIYIILPPSRGINRRGFIKGSVGTEGCLLPTVPSLPGLAFIFPAFFPAYFPLSLLEFLNDYFSQHEGHSFGQVD